MIAITQAEKEAICERFPRAHIVRTVKQKSKRHHYYCEESKHIINFLNQMYDQMYAPKDSGVNYGYN